MNLRTCFALLLAALPLLGATDSGPDIPVVVVYPLTVTGDVAANTGSNIGTAIANKLVQLGGLTVKPFTAGTLRAQYLTAADAEGADYYITGYLTPLGTEVSVVEQVVSTRSGSIVFSTTAFAKTYADAVGPADTLREAILRHAGRGLASLNAPPPTASPEPIANANGVNISKAFGRHRKGAPAAASAQPGIGAASASAAGTAAVAATATTAATTATAAPRSVAAGIAPATHVALGAPTVDKALVVATAGGADAGARNYASTSLGQALRLEGVANAPLGVSAADVSAHAADLCRANAAVGFYAATLAVTGADAAASVRLDVTAYDCHGAITGQQQASASAGKRGSVRSAIDAAAKSVANGFKAAHGPAIRATPPAAT